MNDTLKSIFDRRSIRKYRHEQISDEELNVILEAGKYAPSAQNKQSWHFTVIQNREILQKINTVCKDILMRTGNKTFKERVKEIEVEKFNIMHNAPTLMVVSGDERAVAPQIDCNLAMENMMIASESLNIGSCWIYAIKLLYDTEEGRDFLTKQNIIPEGHIFVAASVFGYKSAESPSPVARREGTVTIIR